jgi:hypothetical protein
MKYITHCTNCKNETKVSRTHTVFWKAKPYCWACRSKLIGKWVKEQRKENDNHD